MPSEPKPPPTFLEPPPGKDFEKAEDMVYNLITVVISPTLSSDKSLHDGANAQTKV